MIPNGKLVASDGNQVAVFPSQDMYITQGTNTNYSHKGTKNTDNASASNRRKLYAPCDMKLYLNASSGGYGILFYHSVKPVHTARYGLTHITMVLMHDNNAHQFVQGKTYKQGEHIYTEGDADPSGLTTGIHVHYEVAVGHQYSRTRLGEGYNYEIVNSVYLDDIFFNNMTNIIRDNPPANQFQGDHVYNWLTFDGETGVDPSKPSGEDGIYHAILSKAFPFNF